MAPIREIEYFIVYKLANQPVGRSVKKLVSWPVG